MKNQRGEIVTLLTIISLGLMMVGLIAGKKAVQQRTQLQSRAMNQVKPLGRYDCIINCDPDTQDCIDGECVAKKTKPFPNHQPKHHRHLLH